MITVKAGYRVNAPLNKLVVKHSGGSAAGALGTVSNNQLADMAAYTIKLRNAGTTGDPQDVKISTLTEEVSPASGDWILGENDAGVLVKMDVSNVAGSGGDFVGPASSTDNAIVRFDGTTGKLGQNSGATIDDSGNITATNISGTNTGDQTITLTGDVTGSGTGSFAATIASDAVTYDKMQDTTTTDVLLGRATAGGGTVEEIACTAFARTLLDDATQGAAQTTLGVDPAGTDNSTNVTLAGALDYITIDGSQVITRNAIDLTTDVTGDLPFSNLAQASGASLLLGRGSAGGAGDFEEITLGTNLSMSGTTLNATGGVDQNLFETIACPAGTNPVADSTTDTLTLANGANIEITGDATTDTVTIALGAHATRHQSGGNDAIKLDDLAAPDDNTDLNATTGAHGLLPKLSGVATEFLNGNGAFSVPAGGGGMSIGGTVTGGTTGSVLFVGAGPVLAQNNANFFFDNSNVQFALGGNTTGVITVTPQNQKPRQLVYLEDASTTAGQMFILQSDATSRLPVTSFAKSRLGSMALTTGHGVGSFTFLGHDGTNFISAAEVSGQVNGTVATGSVPIDLLFSTGASGTKITNMRITSAGNVLIGQHTTQDAKLDVFSSASDNQVTCVLQQNAALRTLVLNPGSAASAQDCIDLTSNNITTGRGMDFVMSGLTTGRIARFYSNSSSASVRNLIEIFNDNSNSTGCVPLLVRQDSTADSVQLRNTSNAIVAAFNGGNFKLGGVANPTVNAVATIMMGNNGGKPTPAAGSAGFYCRLDAGTLHVYAVDEAGVESPLTPHDHQTGEWIFVSNEPNGRTIRADMERFFKEQFPQYFHETKPLDPNNHPYLKGRKSNG